MAKVKVAKIDAEKKDKVHLSGLKGGQRVKVIEAEDVPQTPEEEEKKKTRKAHIRGKKYVESKSKFDRSKLYPLSEAIKLVKESSYSKFDGTMELHIVVKKTGISANITLPHSAGREKKIEVASEETIKKLAGGKIDFDVLLATAEMMPKLVPFARLLGPRGLMPNPKNGTLIKNTEDADKFSGNAVTIKTEKEAPIIHTTFGKVSQEDKELKENAEIILSSVGKNQLVKAYMKSTMSPSVKLSLT